MCGPPTPETWPWLKPKRPVNERETQASNGRQHISKLKCVCSNNSNNNKTITTTIIRYPMTLFCKRSKSAVSHLTDGPRKASTCQQTKCLKNSKKKAKKKKQKPKKRKICCFFVYIIIWQTASIVLQRLSVPLGVQPAQHLRPPHQSKGVDYNRATEQPVRQLKRIYLIITTHNTQHNTPHNTAQQMARANIKPDSQKI